MLAWILYTLITVGIISLMIGLLWNIKLWSLSFILLSMLMFVISGVNAPNTTIGDITYFEYGLLWFCYGMILVSLTIFFSKLIPEAPQHINQ